MSARRGRAGRRGRTVLFAAVVAAAIAAAGGAYYLLAIYAPAEERSAAQDEVVRWEQRLAAARACLLGDPPASSDTLAALAIRELAPDPWSRRTCTQLIGALSRGETEDTGMPAAEEAWRALEGAASRVGDAFLAHVDPAGDPAKGRELRRLPQALEELQSANAALRKTVGLPPPPARPATPPLPAAELVPLRDGDRPVRELESWTIPTMGSVVAFGRSEARELQLTLAPGAPAIVKPVGDGFLRTVPDAAWGAGGGVDHIVIGPLDDQGNLTPPATGPIDKRALKVEGRGRVFAVAGTAEDGLVVAGGETSLVLVRAQGGKLTADKPIAIEQLAFALDPGGRALIAYNDDPDGKLWGLVARGAAAGKPIQLGETLVGGACLTRARGWIAGPDSDQILAFDPDGGAVTPHTWAAHDLLGCTADAALLQQRNATHFVVCAEQCRVAVLQGMRVSSIAALAGDEVVALVLRDRVLGVWREQGPARYFTLGTPLTALRLALSDGKVIDVVGQSADGVVIARVPAR